MDELRLSFGRVAALFDRVRPSYLQESLDRAQQVLELKDSAEVLDLAAGTGRLTHDLAGRFARVIAVEPDDAMRALIADGEVLAGTAEAIPLDDASVDAVFVGEAFHWFDAERAVPEIARVLRPRGGLARLSNQWWETDPPLPERALELLREPYVASGRAASVETWRDAFARSAFDPLRDETFASELTVDGETLLSLYQTTSSIAALPEAERAALAAELRALLDGPYVLPVRVELTWTRLRR
ncbi:MAG TPA: methyltransferase domain-containing protein [Gaiellaceae bacterium]|nr:methyltransferase domain-containing protein [Gaiellaceae bacterium]